MPKEAAPHPFLTVVEPPVPAGGDLPRMDVAAFAGFAEAGPFGVPVCVESADGFAAVFGRPLALPGGPGRLADAAAAFFAQGGRRAWIVRCGDVATAPARFSLPGVVALLAGETSEDDDRVRPAALAARSAGTFVDDQRLSAAVRRTRILFRPDGDAVWITAADGDVAADRLVELPVLRGGRRARRYAVLGTPDRGAFPLGPALTVTDAPVLDTELTGRVGDRPARMARDAAGRARIAIEPAPDASGAITDGALLRFDPDPVRPPLPARKLRAPEPATWVLVDDVSSPRPGATAAAVVVSGQAVIVDRDPAGDLQAGVGAALSLELSGRSVADGAAWRLSDVGCAPGAPGWPGELPADRDRYAEADGPVAPAAAPVCGAGLDAVLALVPLFSSAFELAPISTGRPSARNGIVRGLRQELLGRKPGLATTSVAGLGSLVAARDRGAAELPGIAALLDAPEPTLFAVPDAVAGDLPAALGALGEPVRLPALPPETDEGFGTCAPPPGTPALADAALRPAAVALSWVARGAAAFEAGVFASAGATAPARILYRGPAEITGSGITPSGEVAPVFGITVAAGDRGWARVRALDGTGRAGGWSIGVPLPRTAAGGEAMTWDATSADLLAVHGVLLRMAALRGDTLALLSVPPTWTAAKARAHVEDLRSRIGEQERHALAFGTLAHPWPRVPAPAPDLVRAVPADAALAGQLAAMAATRGA
jgi:hypothetical protein